MRCTSVSFLGTSTGLAIQVSFFVSRMNWALSSRLTSSPIALRLGSENRRSVCFTGLVFGLMRSACSTNSRGIPGMSVGHQAKISHFSRRKAMRAVACSSGRWAYTRTVFSGSVGCTWWVTVSLSMLKSRPYSFDSLRLANGKMLLFVGMTISFSSCSAPKVSETLWKSRSHWSDLVPVNCNTARSPWHLELEVGIVWNRHELRERWPPQYGVVLRLPVEYLELEGLSCEV